MCNNLGNFCASVTRPWELFQNATLPVSLSALLRLPSSIPCKNVIIRLLSASEILYIHIWRQNARQFVSLGAVWRTTSTLRIIADSAAVGLMQHQQQQLSSSFDDDCFVTRAIETDARILICYGCCCCCCWCDSRLISSVSRRSIHRIRPTDRLMMRLAGGRAERSLSAPAPATTCLVVPDGRNIGRFKHRLAVDRC